MWNKVAYVTSMADLRKYFSGQHWRVKGLSDSSMEAESPNYEIQFKSQGFMYHVHVEAVDDPSDAEDKVTDDPVGAIVQFLETGTPGDEFLHKMSSDPSAMSAALLSLASDIESGVVGPRRLRGILRRIAAAPHLPLVRRIAAAAARRAAGGDEAKEELADLMKSMKAKGWKIKETTSDAGLPKLTVDVSGIYEATIGVESISWQYKFQVKDKPDTLDEGVTDEPIEHFRKYYKSPEVQEAKQDRKFENSETEPAPSSSYDDTEYPSSEEPPAESGSRTKKPVKNTDDEETFKPKKAPPSSEEKTVKPGKAVGK